jgi:hypothetical protein
MSKSDVRRRIPLYRTLFIDLMVDRRSRPVIIYAALTIGVGTVLYHWLEGWSWVDSLYFVIITLTTIGYGDFTPTTDLTKLITVFYSLNGVIMLLMLFDVTRRVRGWYLGSPAADNGREST